MTQHSTATTSPLNQSPEPHFAVGALFVAPHPDDAEIFCGGVMALLAQNNHRVVLLDLTRGEMGSQGSAELRESEAEKAKNVLGLHGRENLRLPDGGLSSYDENQKRAVVSALRRIRPELVFAPYWEDRHPDHREASDLVTRAVFLAGLKKYAPELGKPFQPRQVLYYQMRTAFRPSVVVDVTPVYATKRAAITVYSSQLIREKAVEGAPPTLVSSPLSQSSIEARDQYYGAMIGVSFAEPLLVRTALALKDPVEHFRANPIAETLILPGDL
ncbi:MAG: bacillithiol biosynthesis deacetylase BshB1 [Bdellovibrionota bacterium]